MNITFRYSSGKGYTLRKLVKEDRFMSGYDGRVYDSAYEFANIAPIADAGDGVSAFAGISDTVGVTLDGSGSYDPDGDELSYLWTWNIEGEPFEANGVSPMIELPTGEHVIELVVNDGVGDSEPNSVCVAVIAPIEAKMFFVPRVINRGSRGTFVMAVIYLPEDTAKGDIVDDSFTLYVNGDESNPIAPAMHRFVGNRSRGRVFVVFNRADLTAALAGDDGAVRVDVAGLLADGRYICGSDTIRSVRPARRTPRTPQRNTSSGRADRRPTRAGPRR